MALELPTEISQPVDSIGQLVILLYGERKIGKTSFCSEFDDTIFFFFEPGGKGLSTYQLEVPDWNTFIQAVKLLTQDKKFKTVVIDTVDICYDRCLDFVCTREGIDHPSDVGYGKAWKQVDLEFKEQLNKLMLCGKGVVLVSHAQTSEFINRRGNAYHKIVPTMSGQARKYIIGCADILAYYGYSKEDRYLIIAGEESMEAGHRLDKYFKTPAGERIRAIPMGNSQEEAYKNFVKAFNNQQTEVYDESYRMDQLETAKPMGKK